MKNSAIYLMALTYLLVLSLADVQARGLGAGGGGHQQQAPQVQQQQAPRVQQQQAPRIQQQQAPRVQQQQAPRVQQQQAPRVQQQQAPRVQQQQAPRSSGRPGGGTVTSAPSLSRPSHVPAQSVQSPRQVSRPSHVPAQSVQKPVTTESKPHGASQRADKLPISGIQPGTRASGTKRPTQGQVQHFLNLPKPSEDKKPGLGTVGAAAGGAAAALALQRLTKPGERAHRPDGDRTGMDRPEIGERPTTEHGRHGVNAQVAQQIRSNYRQQNILNPGWWSKHPHLANEYWHNNVWHNQEWRYWWRPATWAIAAGWFPWGWSSPVSYDYGNNVLYDDDIVYMNGERVATGDEYYEQATQLASTAKDDTADKTEWLPLGVFALSRGDTGVSNTVLQLAVSKEGVISGTYYNSDTDIARPVKGTVDKKTQRAAWTFADGKDTNIVMETGINNLTQDQTEALVHFGKDITQQWLMVRLQEPPAQKTEKGDS